MVREGNAYVKYGGYVRYLIIVYCPEGMGWRRGPRNALMPLIARNKPRRSAACGLGRLRAVADRPVVDDGVIPLKLEVTCVYPALSRQSWVVGAGGPLADGPEPRCLVRVLQGAGRGGQRRRCGPSGCGRRRARNTSLRAGSPGEVGALGAGRDRALDHHLDVDPLRRGRGA